MNPCFKIILGTKEIRVLATLDLHPANPNGTNIHLTREIASTSLGIPP